MAAHFTKLKNGKRGIRSSGAVPVVGTKIQVTKKNGAVSEVKIADVLWTGPDKRSGQIVAICSIGERKVAPTHQAAPKYQRRYSPRGRYNRNGRWHEWDEAN